MIVTARIEEADLTPFDDLRRMHFPPDRNFLRAHMTMFHRLPGEYLDRIVESMAETASRQTCFYAQVDGVRHLGAGVAYSVTSTELATVRSQLKTHYAGWLGPQDQQKWLPHITIQNRVLKPAADSLHRQLQQTFVPHPISITGLELWRYLDGPWQLHSAFPFASKA